MLSVETMDSEELTPPCSPVLIGQAKTRPPCSPVLHNRLTSPLCEELDLSETCVFGFSSIHSDWPGWTLPLEYIEPNHSGLTSYSLALFNAKAKVTLLYHAAPMPGAPLSRNIRDAELLCFRCFGDLPSNNTKNSVHPAGPLRRGAVSRLTEQKMTLLRYDSPAIKVFDFMFPSCLFMPHDIDLFFNILKQRIIEFDILDGASLQSTDSLSGFEKRQQIRKAFDYILSSVISLKRDFDDATTAVIRILENVRQLMLYTRLLCEKSQSKFSVLNLRSENKSASSFHALHSHIESWWACIEIFHTISVTFPADLCVLDSLVESRTMCSYRFFEDVNSCEVDLVTESVLLILWDVVILASQKHNTMTLEDYDRVSMFPCPCVRELFIMLVQFLRDRQFKSAKQSFWMILTSILHHFLVNDQLTPQNNMEINSHSYLLPPDNVTSKDAIGFCWWILIQVAPLYQFDQSGGFNSAHVPTADCYSFVQTLVEKSLSLSESRLRCYLRCLICLLRIWDKNSKLISLLWDHFYRKLNDQLLIPELSISSLASISLSASDLLGRCKKLTDCDGHFKQDNSYFLFLRILCFYLGGTTNGAKSNSEWRQMKGRMYSKFNLRKIQDLNEMGLHNLTSLFLVLAQVVDIEDVSSKLLELCSAVGNSSQEFFRRRMFWKAILALCILYIERRIDVSPLADRLSVLFQEACNELQHSRVSVNSRGELWRLFRIYLEGVQDVIECSEQFDLHEDKLIGDGFQELLNLSRDSELVYILDFLQAIFTKQRIVYRRILQCGGQASKLTGLSNALWKNAYSFIKQRCSSVVSHYPPQLADVAASFALLAINFLPSQNTGIRERFLDCFQFFGLNDQVDVSVSCRFLCHMLPNQSVIEKLSSDLPDFERSVIKSWFRVAWYLDPTSDCMQELARQISKLPAFISVFRQANADVPGCSDCPTQFIKALGRGYTALPLDFHQRMEYRTKALDFFGDVVKHCTLKDSTSQEQADLVYNLAGHILKYCAQLTYVKSNAYCLFPLILEKLCLPRAVLLSKDLPPHLVSSLKQFLHLFMQGLSQLDFSRDPYLQRKLREIVIHHLPRFQRVTSVVLVASVSSVHPIVRSLSSSYRDVVSSEASAFRQNLIEIVKGEFFRDFNSPDSLKALSFLISVEERMKNPVEISKDAQLLLPMCLNRLLVTGNISEKELVTHLKGLLLDAYKTIPSSSPLLDGVRSVLKDFIGNIRLYQSRVFKVLESVASAQPSLMVDLLPVITETVKSYELRKDIIDTQLRMNYFVFLSSLGDAGDAEKVRLMQDRS